MIAIKSNLSWKRTKSTLFLRQWQITSTVSQFAFFLFSDFVLRKNNSLRSSLRAKWLVTKLIYLGPTFIKIGQALSTRPDLIPVEYVNELSKLQDNVPPFDSIEAIALIESELNKNLGNIYQEIEKNPIAAASLGQVHRAKLFTGEIVVVKVQRKGLEELFNLDFQVLKRLINFSNFFVPAVRKYNLKEIYQEFFTILFSEIDYIQEGENADRFRLNFQNDNQILVPKVYWEYTTKKILTLEYLPGIKINDRETLLKEKIAIRPLIELGICSYLKQLLEDGFFQSDPHPGNMAVNKRGNIIFYDFGAMTEVQVLAQEQMVQTFFAMLRKDTDQVLESLIYMGIIEPQSDLTPLKRLISFSLNRFLDKPIDVKAFKEISTEIYIMFEQQPFRLPAQLTFIIKALTTLDGIARNLDPQYSLIAASQPFVSNLTKTTPKANLVLILARQGKLLVKQQLGKSFRFQTMSRNLQNKLETGELQVRVRSLEAELLKKTIVMALKALIYTCLTGFSLIGAILLVTTVYRPWAFILFGLTGLFTLLLVRSLIRLKISEKQLK